MAVFDISRACFMAPVDREACVELPQEDKLLEDGDAVGLLLRSMCEFRTSSANWQRDWQATLEQAGYKVGVANDPLFYSAEGGCRGGVHRDDFAVVGSRRALDRMRQILASKYPCENHTDLALGATVSATLSC